MYVVHWLQYKSPIINYQHAQPIIDGVQTVHIEVNTFVNQEMGYIFGSFVGFFHLPENLSIE